MLVACRSVKEPGGMPPVAGNSAMGRGGIGSEPSNCVPVACNSVRPTGRLAAATIERMTWGRPGVAASGVRCMRAQRGAAARQG